MSPDGFGSVQFSSVVVVVTSSVWMVIFRTRLGSTMVAYQMQKVFRILPLLQPPWLFFCLAMNFALEFS